MGDDSASPYLMEHGAETARLERKTIEEETLHQLALVGLEPGMTVLDAGTGSASVARTMAHVVGPTGRVVAVDRSLDRLIDGARLAEPEPLRPTSCVVDLHCLPFKDSFDLVWSRFVVEYLPDPLLGIRSLFGAVAPGGKLVVGDVDGHGLNHFPVDEEVEIGLEKVQRGVEGMWDPYMGRKLFHLCRQLPTESIRVHQLPYHLYPGRASDAALSNWKAKFDVIRPVVEPGFRSTSDYRSFVEAFMTMLANPDVFTYSVLFLVEAVKPHAEST